MAEHGSVEQELWNIFTFYTLHGNPMYPDLLKSSQFSKLCKQCLIMKTPEMPNGLPGAVINVVYIGKFVLTLKNAVLQSCFCVPQFCVLFVCWSVSVCCLSFLLSCFRILSSTNERKQYIDKTKY